VTYEVFDHTADAGLRVCGADLDELLREGARALTAVLVADPRSIPADRTERLAIEAGRLDDLFFDFLAELLVRFDTSGFVARRVELEVSAQPPALRATVEGGTFDPDRHAGGHEVKAITYHDLEVRRTDGGYEARVIIDI